MKTVITIGNKAVCYTVRLIALTLAMLIGLSISHITVTAYGGGMYSGMAYIAEKDIRAKYYQITVDNTVTVDNIKENSDTKVADVDKGENKSVKCPIEKVKAKVDVKKC